MLICNNKIYWKIFSFILINDFWFFKKIITKKNRTLTWWLLNLDVLFISKNILRFIQSNLITLMQYLQRWKKLFSFPLLCVCFSLKSQRSFPLCTHFADIKSGWQWSFEIICNPKKKISHRMFITKVACYIYSIDLNKFFSEN